MSVPSGGGRLGEILVASAGLSPADLARGLALARSEHVRLGSALVGLGLVTADDIATALARQKGVVAARDKHLDAIVPETRVLLPAPVAKRLCAVAVGVVRGERPELVVAMRDPDDRAAIAELAKATGYPIRPAAACEARLRELVDAQAEVPLVIASSKAPPLIDLTPLPVPVPVPVPVPDLVPLPDTPTLVPALQLEPLPDDAEEDDDGPIGGTPSRPIIVDTNELELEQRPPRVPRPPATPVPIAPPLAAMPDDAPARPARWSWPLRLLALGLVLGVAVLIYDVVAGSDDDAPAARGVHHSTRVGATFRLRGEGWREAPEGIDASGLPPGTSGRVDLFARGDRASAPDAMVVIARVTVPGLAGAHVGAAELDAAMTELQPALASMGGGAFKIEGLSCGTSTLRGAPLGACGGTSHVPGGSYDVHLYVWIAGGDDTVLVAWFDRGGGEQDALALVESVRLD